MKLQTKLITALLVTFFCLSVGVATAQEQRPPPNQQPGPGRPPDPLDDAMFPPDLIMGHQRELGLTDDQKTYMRGEIQRTTSRFNELNWQLQDAMEALHETMKSNPVNEQLALSQLDKVLDNEREIKRLHMELAIRLKNKLTPDQQSKLMSIKQTMRRGDGPGPGGPGGPGPGRGPGRPGAPGPPHGAGPGPGAPEPGDLPPGAGSSAPDDLVPDNQP